MKDIRPDFKDIKSFEEFNQYYWYREELSQICKSLGLEYRGTKKELVYIIEQYFQGNKIANCLVVCVYMKRLQCYNKCINKQREG